MNKLSLPVVTLDYPENLNNGVMICGINFGYDSKEEKLDRMGTATQIDAPSFFSDKTVNNTRFRNRLVKWFNSWGMKLSADAVNLTATDKAFYQTNWLNTQTKSINSDEKITIDTLIADSAIDPLLALIEVRKPQAIVFVGKMLIEAFNDIRIRDKVENLLGKRPGNAKIHKGNSAAGGRAFSILSQVFGETTIICLPHTNSIGLTDAYMADINLPKEIIAALNGK